MENPNQKLLLSLILVLLVVAFGGGYYIGSKRVDVSSDGDRKPEKTLQMKAYADSLKTANDSLAKIIMINEEDIASEFDTRPSIDFVHRSQVSTVSPTDRYSTDSIIARFTEAKRRYDSRDSGYYEVFRSQVRNRIGNTVD